MRGWHEAQRHSPHLASTLIAQLPHSKKVSPVLAKMRAVGETTCTASGRLGHPERWLLSNCDITKCCPAPSVALNSPCPLCSLPQTRGAKWAMPAYHSAGSPGDPGSQRQIHAYPHWYTHQYNHPRTGWILGCSAEKPDLGQCQPQGRGCGGRPRMVSLETPWPDVNRPSEKT